MSNTRITSKNFNEHTKNFISNTKKNRLELLKKNRDEAEQSAIAKIFGMKSAYFIYSVDHNEIRKLEKELSTLEKAKRSEEKPMLTKLEKIADSIFSHKPKKQENKLYTEELREKYKLKK